MRESSKRHWEAVVAALMWKLRPANFLSFKPAAARVNQSLDTKLALVKYLPSLHLNRGPGSAPLSAIYCKIASTGHRLLFMAPRWRVKPCQKGSAFEAFIVISKRDGQVWLSTWTFSKQRCVWLSLSIFEGETTSPEQRNLKRHREAAPQSILTLNWSWSAIHTCFNLIRINGVIGRWHLTLLGEALFIPLIT